jgi:4-methoxybenzoate monooxygenase (O-demethylating)
MSIPTGSATAGVPTSDLDLFSREVIADQQRFDAMLRELGPVVHMTHYDVWVTGRYDPIQRMYRDWETFSSTEPAFAKDGPSILLSEDPPAHTRVRAVIQRALSPRVMKAMAERFEREAHALVDRIMDGGGPVEVDGHVDLAKRYVLKVFPDVLGLGEEGRDNLIRFGHAQFNAFGPENEVYRESFDEAREVFAWIAQHTRREAISPDGLADEMYKAADRGELTYEEAELLVRTLYAAGADTTIFALGNVLRAFADFPEQWDALRADPSLARAAFEEGVRWDNPARYTRRRTTRAVDLEGVPMPADAKILILHGPAGRDPRQWEDPLRFDISRRTSGHVGFGYGIHACVGQSLARLEGASLLGALARRVERIELAGTPRTTVNMAVHGHESLPLRLLPSQRTENDR